MTKTIAKIRPIAVAALLLAATQAYAVGTGTIADGVGSIGTVGRTTTVNQSSDKLIINWDNMDVASNETLAFRQPSATASVLNRINSVDPTNIMGTLNSNGRVFIVNPNGVMIGAGARVNVGSLVASSLNITDQEFMKGTGGSNREVMTFTGGGQGDVVNDGQINATNSVALIGAKRVENNGTITSNSGDITLIAGDRIYTYYENQRMSASRGEGSADAQVNNNGSLRTADGDIMLYAAVREAVARSVVNNTGTIEARSLTYNEGGDQPVYGNASLIVDVQQQQNSGQTQIRVDGSVDAQTRITMRGDEIRIDGGLYSDGIVDMAGNNVVTMGESKLEAGSLFVNAENAAIVQGDIKVGGDASVTGGYVLFGAFDQPVPKAAIGGDLIITADTGANVKGVNAGNIQVRGGRDGWATSVADIVARGDLDISTQGQLQVDGAVDVGGHATLSGASVYMSDWTWAGLPPSSLRARSVDISAKNQLVIDAPLVAEGDVALYAPYLRVKWEDVSAGRIIVGASR